VRIQNLPFPYLARLAQFLFNLTIIMLYAVPARGRIGAKIPVGGGLSPGGDGRAAENAETVGQTTRRIQPESGSLEWCRVRTQEQALEFVSLLCGTWSICRTRLVP
jgi:hypothetical protein